MSSADDYYYDFQDSRYNRRRASNRARRRGSAQSRRRRRCDGYIAHKSRRAKAWYNHNAPRFIAACIFLFLLSYEVVILKGPLIGTKNSTIRDSSLSSSTTAHASVEHSQPLIQREQVDEKEPTPPLHPPAPSPPQTSTSTAPESKPRAPVSFENGATTADRVRAAAQAPADDSSHPPPYRPLRKHKRPSARTDSVKVVKERKPAPASALSLESKPADADDDDDSIDPDNTSKKSSPSSKNRRSSRSSFREKSSARSKRSEKPSTDADADIDINPPKTRKRGKVGEGGAEPGAGENFWQWFQDTKGNEKGAVSNNIKCPEENKRLCQMFYKYLRKYKIRCIFDASCAVNVDWMPEILQKAGNELWGFKYYCGVTDEAKMEAAKEKLGSLNFVEFIPDHWWRDGFPEDTELLFAWDTLPHIAYGRVWNFFVKAKKQDIKYILVDNYPGIMNDPSPKRNYLNIRKHPFRFPAAKEVVQNVTEPGETAKRQLLFYEGSMLPDNLQ